MPRRHSLLLLLPVSSFSAQLLLLLLPACWSTQVLLLLLAQHHKVRQRLAAQAGCVARNCLQQSRR
jgi:hypothetical protein